MDEKVAKRTARLLDANLNRAREGLRVVEDTARFVWNDNVTYKKIRSLRHKLHDVSKNHYEEFLAARESLQDVGRKIAEGPRSTVLDVVRSNIRRAQEASRVLEEYSKIFSRSAAPLFKQIRYQLYTEEKRLLKRK